MPQPISDLAYRPAGYAALVERYKLDVVPNWHRSFVAAGGGTHRKNSTGDTVEEVFPSRYWPGETVGEHLEFALKYDGANLALLSAIFEKTGEKELADYIGAKPTGKYVRRLWFLYEYLTGRRLPLEDVRHGNYVDLLDPGACYTIAPGRQVRRQRINDNLPGDRRFCPIVRRTEVLDSFESADLPGRCRQIVSRYPPEVIHRAIGYLYSKETKSSFEIEHIKPSRGRTERFVAQLQLAEKKDFCEKNLLIDLQNQIVDPRFRDPDYRLNQNYVGETVSWQTERIHFVAPKPDDLPELMEGLISSHQRMEDGGVSPVVHAAIIGFGFVFLHPFEDGNGRIHRFLIHNILARRGFTPEGMVFPISAVMLKEHVAYDRSLEAFSNPLLTVVDYNLDEDKRMTVHSDTAKWYAYPDLTAQAEALFRFIDKTIETELVEGLQFLANYDRTKRAIQEIVDMPDRKIDLLVRFCLQGKGRLSARKRAAHFDFLSDEETEKLERAVQNGFERPWILDDFPPGK